MRGVLANAGWLYLDQAVRSVVTLVTFGLMTRALGQAGIGYLSYALAFPAIFIPLGALGLDFVVIRELVRRPAEQSVIFATGFWLKLGGSAVAFVVCTAAGFAFVDAADPARALLVITTLTLLLHPSTIIDCFFQSRVASKYSAVARMVSSLAASGFRIWLVLSGRPLVDFAWAYLLELTLLAVAMLVAFRLDGSLLQVRLRDFNAGIARMLLAAAWPLFLADIAIALYSRFSFVLLDHLAGAESLGRYAAAMRLSDAIVFFPLAVIGSYFPRIVSLHRESPADFPERLRRFMTIMTWGTVAVALFVTLFGPWLVRIILGAGFAASAGVLIYLVWGNVFATQVAVRGRWFLAEELQIYTFWFFALGAAIQLGLFYIFVPRLDAEGAAAAFLCGQIAMAILLPLLLPRSRQAGKMAVASFLPGPILSWIRRRRGVHWTGDYATWTEAHAATPGYESPVIIERVIESSRLVRDGRAAAERDSVVFAEPPQNLPLDSGGIL